MKLVGRAFARGALGVLIAPLIVGCTGEIGASSSSAPGSTTSRAGGGPGSGAPGATSAVSCTSPSPGPSPLRRLTHREYDNTVRQLLGDTSDLAKAFVRRERLDAGRKTRG